MVSVLSSKSSNLPSNLNFELKKRGWDAEEQWRDALLVIALLPVKILLLRRIEVAFSAHLLLCLCFEYTLLLLRCSCVKRKSTFTCSELVPPLSSEYGTAPSLHLTRV